MGLLLLGLAFCRIHGLHRLGTATGWEAEDHRGLRVRAHPRRRAPAAEDEREHEGHDGLLPPTRWPSQGGVSHVHGKPPDPAAKAPPRQGSSPQGWRGEIPRGRWPPRGPRCAGGVGRGLGGLPSAVNIKHDIPFFNRPYSARAAEGHLAEKLRRVVRRRGHQRPAARAAEGHLATELRRTVRRRGREQRAARAAQGHLAAVLRWRILGR